MKKLLQLITVLVTTIPVKAYDFEVGGIYYNKLDDGQSVAVTYQAELRKNIGGSYNTSYSSPYFGDFTIPPTVTFEGITYSVTTIGNFAFRESKSLTSVVIPNSVTKIESQAFEYCRSLASVAIPESVTSIGERAFYGCTSLKTVVIPNSVTYISGLSFESCTSLTSVMIPNTITVIYGRTFNNCSSLNSVVIGNSVTNINIGAFAYCSSLKSITSLNPTPPTIHLTLYDSFAQSNYENCTLKVPASALNAYKNAEGWNKFKNIVGIQLIV